MPCQPHLSLLLLNAADACLPVARLLFLSQVNGLLGPACRADKKSPHVADTEVGQGGTTLWKMAGLDQDTSVAVFFEVTGNNANAEQVRRGSSNSGRMGRMSRVAVLLRPEGGAGGCGVCGV
jgi:hypothetical protein